MFVLIAGAGALGREVAEMLVDDGHDVVVVDRDEAVCDAIYAQVGAVAVQGDATSLAVLEDAGAGRADVVVTTMRSDSSNVACGLLARSLGAERVVARMQDPSYEDAYVEAGVTQLIRSTSLMTHELLARIQHPEVTELMTLGSKWLCVFSLELTEGAWAVGKTVAEVARHDDFPDACLFVALIAADGASSRIPHGDDGLRQGETVLFIANPEDVSRVTGVMGA